MKKNSTQNKKLHEQRRLQNQLISSQKPLVSGATRIIVKSDSGSSEGSQFKSHVGGQPYFEIGYELWPKTKKNKKLDFVLQIFNDGNIAMPQNIKLVQFFMDLSSLPTKTEDDGWYVRIYEELNPEDFVFIEKPKERDSISYSEFEFEPTSISGKDIDTRLGGQPYWLQSGTDEFDEYLLLLQIDSLDIHVSWYDCGVAYIFYNPKNQKTGFCLEYC